MAQAQVRPFAFDTFEGFSVWERTQDVKHELVDGVPMAMAGANEGHNIIQANILGTALARLRGTPCRPFSSDMAVKTGTNKGRYPDVTIDCGSRNPGNQWLPQPTVVFEVLSPATQKEDRTIKLAEYNAVPSIAHYVLVEQSEPLVHIYSRGPGGDFLIRPQEVRGLDDAFELPAVGLRLTMAEIYDGLEAEPGPTP